MDVRLTEHINNFLIALMRLEEAIAQPENSFLRDATIKRFTSAYDLAHRVITLWLDIRASAALDAKDKLQAALEQGLITDNSGWNELSRIRTLAYSAYSEIHAIHVYDFVKADGVRLFKALAAAVHPCS
jgi:nucleotidyltransferase substrate binding protein (TIGR01987 family)